MDSIKWPRNCVSKNWLSRSLFLFIKRWLYWACYQTVWTYVGITLLLLCGQIGTLYGYEMERRRSRSRKQLIAISSYNSVIGLVVDCRRSESRAMNWRPSKSSSWSRAMTYRLSSRRLLWCGIVAIRTLLPTLALIWGEINYGFAWSIAEVVVFKTFIKVNQFIFLY